MTGNPVPMGWASLFETAFARSSNPMALCRPDRTILAINPAFVDGLGYRREALIGRRLDDLAPSGTRAQRELDWQQLERTGHLEVNRDVLHADGQRVPTQFAARRATLGEREVILVVQLWENTDPLRVRSGLGAASGILTPRELEVVAGIAMGQRASEIGHDLFIAPTTVRTHIRNAMAKLGARSQAQLVAIALTTGSLDVERLCRIAEPTSADATR